MKTINKLQMNEDTKKKNLMKFFIVYLGEKSIVKQNEKIVFTGSYSECKRYVEIRNKND